MSLSSLRLFNSVVISDSVSTDNYEILQQHGILIAPSAIHAKDEIIKYAKKEKLTATQLHKSFYKSWDKASTVSIEDRLRDQLLHYFTTYGLMSMGLDTPDFIYLPEGDYDVPDRVTFLTIKGLTKEELKNACFHLLSSGIALKQETIEDILVVLKEVGHTFRATDLNLVKNREALCIICNELKILPTKGEELFRYLVYSATKQSLIIKNKELITLIVSSKFILPNFNQQQLEMLAESFNRYKPLWLAFKKSNDANRSVVNTISRLSKTKHKPQPLNVLSNLTWANFNREDVTQALQRANVFQITRSINSLSFYSKDIKERFYRIRNGKGYATRKEARKKRYSYVAQLKNSLSGRLTKSIFVPEGIDYAIPTSEKQYCGNIPKNTKITVPVSTRNLLIGIYWENEGQYHVDFDLSAISLKQKVGWNSIWNSDGINYSGDVTSAPNGASEYLYCQDIDDEYLIVVNGYSVPSDHPYKIIVGYGNGKISKNHMIDPNNIIIEASTVMSRKQNIIGVLKKVGDNLEFYLLDQSLGNKNVGYMGEQEKIALAAVLSQTESSLRLSDITNITTVKTDDVLDLSPNNLKKDSLTSLFS